MAFLHYVRVEMEFMVSDNSFKEGRKAGRHVLDVCMGDARQRKQTEVELVFFQGIFYLTHCHTTLHYIDLYTTRQHCIPHHSTAQLSTA